MKQQRTRPYSYLRRMKRTLLLIGSASMVMAIVLGAFGAHGLKELIDNERLSSFEVGVRYQIYHALGLLVLAALYREDMRKTFKWSSTLMVLGTILFSFSIYLLACRSIFGLEGLAKVLGPITPIGGLLLISSWVLLFVGFFKAKW